MKDNDFNELLENSYNVCDNAWGLLFVFIVKDWICNVFIDISMYFKSFYT